jgi:glycosyltransferase involved in cell wall biosynthesis
MVSVIIPNYNHSKYLGERIDSIFNQTYQDFELIILDGLFN